MMRWNAPRPADWWQPLLLTGLLLLSAEGFVRTVLVGDPALAGYWDPSAGGKFLHYQRAMAAGQPPEVLIIGDSTAARTIDPQLLTATLGGALTAYNLGTDGNFPGVLRGTTFPLLASEGPMPRLVIYMLRLNRLFQTEQSPGERQIMASPVYRKATGQYRWWENLRPRLTRARLFLAFKLGRGTKIRADGFAPLPATRQATPGDVADNLARSRAGLGHGIPAERVTMLRDLARLVRDRGGQLCFVAPPLASPELEALDDPAVALLNTIAAESGATVIDLRGLLAGRPECFADGSHVNAEGAALVTERLARELARRGLPAAP